MWLKTTTRVGIGIVYLRICNIINGYFTGVFSLARPHINQLKKNYTKQRKIFVQYFFPLQYHNRLMNICHAHFRS